MIRPHSEIEYPASEAQCLKARMIRRMEALASSNEGLMAVISQRIDTNDAEYQSEVDALTEEQARLISNMKRLASA